MELTEELCFDLGFDYDKLISLLEDSGISSLGECANLYSDI